MSGNESNRNENAPKVLALIPAYNEEARVGKVVQSASTYLPVLVVDDGSKDNTSQAASQAGAEVIRQEPNQGKGAAILKGFRYALDNGYDAVITLDADGQHDPDEIPLFLHEFDVSGSDLIIGKRDFRKMPFPRNISNRIGTWSFSNALGQYVPDNQSGYRFHSRRLVEDSLTSMEHGFEFEVEIIVRCVLKGYKISWVTIKTIYNEIQNSKITPLRHIVRFYRLVSKTHKIIRSHKRSI